MVGCPVWLVWWLLVKTDDSVFYGSNNNVSMDGNETWLPCLGVSWCVVVCSGANSLEQCASTKFVPVPSCMESGMFSLELCI
jgi:hypothetical protein